MDQKDEPSRWADYELLKRQFQQDNPDASPSDYEAAMRRLADRLGI